MSLNESIEWNMPDPRVFKKGKRNRELRKSMPTPVKSARRRREDHLAKHYKMTTQEFEALLASQDHACAICGRRDMVWNVDHDHSCCPGSVTCGQCVRGVLCRTCNWTIGKMQDNPEWLREAASYVETRGARLVLKQGGG